MPETPFAEDDAAKDDAGWVPPEEVLTHAGTPIPDEGDFFEPPPSEIGVVRTAWTTLTFGKQPMNPGLKFFLAAGLGMLVAAPLIYLVADGRAIDPLALIVGGSVGAVVMIITWFLIRFKHTCTYVGDDGMARITLKKHRGHEPTRETLIFNDGANLKSMQTRQYYNGIYTGTAYDYTWTDAQGVKLLRLNGSYRAKDGNPKPKDAFHFANQGENFWNNHLADRMQAELDAHGYVEFPVNKKDAVRVGQGFLEFFFKGETQRVSMEEIKKLNVGSGVFTIHTTDAGWFGSKGKFSFNYGQLGNASMFLFALERLLGYTFE